MRAITAMGDLFKHPEHVKLNRYNYMAWRSLIRVDLPAVNVYAIAIYDENHPIDVANAAAIRAQQQDSKTRRRELSSACEPTMPSPNQLHRLCKWILQSIKGKIRCSTTVPS